MYGYIYYKLMNIKRCHKDFDEFVKKCCRTVAGDEWNVIYRFITDDTLNHVYVYNVYRVGKDTLYAWKRKIYVLIAEYLKENE